MTYTLIGWGTPIPYATSMRHLLQNPFPTKDLATHLTAYAADLSTLEGSLPEKAPKL